MKYEAYVKHAYNIILLSLHLTIGLPLFVGPSISLTHIKCRLHTKVDS